MLKCLGDFSMEININNWRMSISYRYNVETVHEKELKEYDYDKSNSTISDGYAKRYRR